LRLAIDLIAWRYELVELTIRNTGNDVVFLAQLSIRADWVFMSANTLPAKTLPVKTTITCSRLIAHVLVDLVFLVLVPIYLRLYQQCSVASCLTAVLLGIPLLLFVDVPLVLIGAANDLVLTDFSPGQRNSDLSVLAMRFLNHGGRIVLAILLPMLPARLPAVDLIGRRRRAA